MFFPPVHRFVGHYLARLIKGCFVLQENRVHYSAKVHPFFTIPITKMRKRILRKPFDAKKIALSSSNKLHNIKIHSICITIASFDRASLICLLLAKALKFLKRCLRTQ
jgi:hypothetical protein